MGLDTKYTVFLEGDYAAAARLSYVTMLRVADADYSLVSGDVIGSRDLGMFTPYVGLTAAYYSASETTSKVDLDGANGLAFQALVGTQFQWKALSIAAEYDVARLNMFSLKVGTAF